MLTEYEITYITKEYLQKNWWIIITYNPPGSQWTFTIPDPIKDNTYKWQNWSMSPDIVAYKKNENCFLIVESKPIYNKADVQKMIKMFSNNERIIIFYDIIRWYANANKLDIIINNQTSIIFAKSHSWDVNLIDEDINTILINKKNDFNPHNFNAKKNILENYLVKSYFSKIKI